MLAGRTMASSMQQEKIHAVSRQQFYEGSSRRVAVVIIRPDGAGMQDKEFAGRQASGQDRFKKAPIENLWTKC
jgi:hypothetical protein